MKDSEIIETVRTDNPKLEQVSNAEIIITKLVRSFGIKEIKIIDYEIKAEIIWDRCGAIPSKCPIFNNQDERIYQKIF